MLDGSGADIRGGSLVFDYTGGSTPAATIQGLLTASYNHGQWNVGKLQDTTAVSSGLTLGWKDDGSAQAVTVMATYAADFNLDGSVTDLDQDVWMTYFGYGTSWQQGDANYDGTVNGLDLDLWSLNVGRRGRRRGRRREVGACGVADVRCSDRCGLQPEKFRSQRSDQQRLTTRCLGCLRPARRIPR